MHNFKIISIFLHNFKMCISILQTREKARTKCVRAFRNTYSILLLFLLLTCFSPACFCIRTTDTFCAALFCLVYVCTSRTENYKQYNNNQYIFHMPHLTFLPLPSSVSLSKKAKAQLLPSQQSPAHRPSPLRDLKAQAP